MSKQFVIHTNESPDSLIQKAKRTASSNNATFSGDSSSGSFSGSGVKGNYRVGSGQVTITVTKKPMIAPWSIVESKIRHFFN